MKGEYEVVAALIDASFTGTFASELVEEGENIVKPYKYYQYLSLVRIFLVFGLIFLSFFERPSWCYRTDCRNPVDPQNVVPGVRVDIKRSPFPTMSYALGLAIELGLVVSIWTCNIFVSFFILGFKKGIFKNAGSFLMNVFTVISVLDILVSFAVVRTWRLSQFVRPFLFIISTKSLRLKVWRIVRALPGIFEVMSIIAVFIVLMAFFGFLLYGTISPQISFLDPLESIFTVQTMLTSSNFPDVMIPYILYQSFSPIVFVVIMLVGYYCLMPLLLAVINLQQNCSLLLSLIFLFQVIFAKTKKQFEEEEQILMEKRVKCLRAAFERLDSKVNFWEIKFLNFRIELSKKRQGFISIKVFYALLPLLSMHVNVPRLKMNRVIHFFKQKGSIHRISCESFEKFHEIFATKFVSSKESSLHKECSCLFHTAFGRFFVKVFTSRIEEWVLIHLSFLNINFSLSLAVTCLLSSLQ